MPNPTRIKRFSIKCVDSNGLSTGRKHTFAVIIADDLGPLRK